MTTANLFDLALQEMTNEELREALRERSVMLNRLDQLSEDELRTLYRYEVCHVAALTDTGALQTDIGRLSEEEFRRAVRTNSYGFEEFVIDLRRYRSELAALEQTREYVVNHTPRALKFLRSATNIGMVLGALLFLVGCGVANDKGTFSSLGGTIFLSCLCIHQVARMFRSDDLKSHEKEVRRLTVELIPWRLELQKQLPEKRSKMLAAIAQIEGERAQIEKELARLSPSAYGCVNTLELRQLMESRREYLKINFGEHVALPKLLPQI